MRHYASLLNAENASLSKIKRKQKTVAKLYQDAVVDAARVGYLHDAALANERYAGFLLHVLQDKQEAKHRLEEAVRFYSDWGAERKAGLLHKAIEGLNE